MTTFFQSELDPLQVIALYGNLLPANLKAKFRFPIQIEELSMFKIRTISHFIPEGAANTKALVALGGYLEQKRKELKLSKINRATTPEVSGYGMESDNDADPTQVEWNNTTVLIFKITKLT